MNITGIKKELNTIRRLWNVYRKRYAKHDLFVFCVTPIMVMSAFFVLSIGGGVIFALCPIVLFGMIGYAVTHRTTKMVNVVSGILVVVLLLLVGASGMYLVSTLITYLLGLV